MFVAYGIAYSELVLFSREYCKSVNEKLKTKCNVDRGYFSYLLDLFCCYVVNLSSARFPSGWTMQADKTSEKDTGGKRSVNSARLAPLTMEAWWVDH